MALKWRKESEFSAIADDREDGSRYLVLRLQSGACYYATWRWPMEKRFKTDGRVHMLDRLYDGPSKEEAARACREHWLKRNSISNIAKEANQ